MENDLLSEFLARHAKLTAAEMRRFAHALLKASEQRQQAEMEKALIRILAEPHGCQFCDSGKLRNPEKPHDPNCGFWLASRAISQPSN